MNPQGASFIPQRPSQVAPQKRGVRRVYVLTYISYILFFVSVFSSVGIFLYGRILDAQLSDTKARLIEEESRFSEGEIESIRVLNTQITLAGDLMNKHLSVNKIFSELERITSQALTLTSFSYKREGESSPEVDIQGKTEVVGSLIFQRDVLSSSELFRNTSFEEVTLTTSAEESDTGVITPDKTTQTIGFSVTTSIPQDLIKYAAVPVDTQNLTDLSEISSLSEEIESDEANSGGE